MIISTKIIEKEQKSYFERRTLKSAGAFSGAKHSAAVRHEWRNEERPETLLVLHSPAIGLGRGTRQAAYPK